MRHSFLWYQLLARTTQVAVFKGTGAHTRHRRLIRQGNQVTRLGLIPRLRGPSDRHEKLWWKFIGTRALIVLTCADCTNRASIVLIPLSSDHCSTRRSTASRIFTPPKLRSATLQAQASLCVASTIIFDVPKTRSTRIAAWSAAFRRLAFVLQRVSITLRSPQQHDDNESHRSWCV